jgi:oligopeptide transport system substrate-binding protein
MKVSKLVRLLGVSIFLLALVVGVANAQEGPKVLVTGINMVGADPETIDPSLMQASQENQIAISMFIGVTRQHDLTGEVVGGMAETWDVSDDGLTYTYHLRQGIPWVHYNADTGAVEQVMDDSGNPRMVTAHDFEYGIKRTFDPATASPYAFLPADYVTNGKEVQAGEAAVDDLGVTAVDDYTLQITTPAAVGFTNLIHGLWMMSALPQWAIDAGGDSWTEPEYINTYGPYTLKEWNHDEDITLIKNPFWPGTDLNPVAKIDEIHYRLLESSAQFTEYQAGTMDAIDTPVEATDQILADPVLSAERVSAPRNCTYYLGFDTTEAPMDNVHLRRAFSLAIDRQSIVDNVTKRGETPAHWAGRPGLNAVPTMESDPDLGISYDPDAAKEELQLALNDLGLASAADLPALILAYGDSANHGLIMQAIQQMWTDTLGVTVELSPRDSTTYFTMLHEDAPVIFRSGWCSDYPDENNFTYDLFTTTSAQNDPNYSSEEFDSVTAEARALTDPAQRLDLYRRAETLLVKEDAAIAPIYWYVFSQLIKPYVEWTPNTDGRQHYERWDVQAH